MNIAPSNNSTLIGYNEIFLNLKNLYDKNLLPNKIIFSGNSGIGKSTFAYHLANYIFSKREDNNPLSSFSSRRYCRGLLCYFWQSTIK